MLVMPSCGCVHHKIRIGHVGHHSFGQLRLYLYRVGVILIVCTMLCGSE